MDIMAQIKARRDALAAEQAAGAPSSDATTAAPALFTEPTEEEKAAALAAAAPEPEPKKVGPPGSYRSVRLERFFKNSGQRVEPNADGFFIPADAEEAAVLAYFATQYDMVEFQDPQGELT